MSLGLGIALILAAVVVFDVALVAWLTYMSRPRRPRPIPAPLDQPSANRNRRRRA